MKQEEKFNEILNLCLDRIIKGETVEQCLRDYPEQSAELKPLLQTALAAKTASTVQPGSEFKARARYEFQAALNKIKSPAKTPSAWTRWRWQWQSAWSLAIMALIIIVFGAGGTFVAARGSMPDNPLYAVKLFSENVQLAFTFSDTGKAELNARYADERAGEIVYAAARGDAPEVSSIASRMNSNMMNITDISNNSLVEASKNSRGLQNNTMGTAGGAEDQAKPESASASVLAPQPANAAQALDQPAATTVPAPVIAAPPPPATTAATTAVPTITVAAAPAPGGGAKSIEPPAVTIRSADGTTGSLETSGQAASTLNEQYADLNLTAEGKMRQIIIENYATLQRRLEQALEVASEDVRPIIRQAMAQAQEEYEKSLRNLEQADFLNSSNR